MTPWYLVRCKICNQYLIHYRTNLGRWIVACRDHYYILPIDTQIEGLDTNGNIYRGRLAAARRLGYFLVIPEKPNQFVPLWIHAKDEGTFWFRSNL